MPPPSSSSSFSRQHGVEVDRRSPRPLDRSSSEAVHDDENPAALSSSPSSNDSSPSSPVSHGSLDSQLCSVGCWLGSATTAERPLLPTPRRGRRVRERAPWTNGGRHRHDMRTTAQALIPVMLVAGLLLTTIGSHIIILSEMYRSGRNDHSTLSSSSVSGIPPPPRHDMVRPWTGVSAPLPSQVKDNYQDNNNDDNDDDVGTTSDTATVLGVALHYDLTVHRRFVGSLRFNGFRGKIFLMTEPDLPSDVEEYLISRNVTIHKLTYTPCTTPLFVNPASDIRTDHDREAATCVAPYPQFKIRWARFPLFRDLLAACAPCTGPVLVTDVRDVFFQRDPFTTTTTASPDAGIRPVRGLQLFQEHRLMTTNADIVRKAVSGCRGNHTMMAHVANRPMLCSGTTIGTRTAMLLYLEAMVREMTVWIATPSCRFTTNGDDQAIHNLLYYTGQFDFIRDVHHIPIETFGPRAGLVNTVGVIGRRVWEAHKKDRAQRGIVSEPQLKKTHYTADYVHYHKDPWDQDIAKRWLGLHLDLTDETGRFINFDGSYSPIVHQYDRFSYPIHEWMENMEGDLYT